MRRLVARLARCRLFRDRRGIAASEFALILPLLLLFSAGTIEYSRLILLTQKLQSSAFILADLTARDRTLSEGQMENIFLAIDNIIQPFPFSENGVALVSSVGMDSSDDPVVNWQRKGSGSMAADSTVGEEGLSAELPEELSLSSGETIIAAEVFYAFTPLFGIGLKPRTIHRISYYKPRLGSLESLLP